jgi:hypothetical protein
MNSIKKPMTIRTNTPNLLDNPPSDLSEGVTTLRTQTAELTALEDRQVPVQAKLAAAWTSLMFFVIYIDYFHLYKPGAIDQIRGGEIFEFDVSGTLLTIFVVVIGIPALMIVLSMTLPARVNRVTNLVVASLQIPLMMFNAVGESWEWASFYGLSIGIEVLILAFILRSAWTWPRTPAMRENCARSSQLGSESE